MEDRKKFELTDEAPDNVSGGMGTYSVIRENRNLADLNLNN